jgi:DegV family protein with EDD domain
VIDSETAVGGMKILVHEINKYRNESIDFIVDKIMKLIPRIRVYAVPETLAYLHKGGRLSKLGFAAGTLLKIKPVIELRKTVSVAEKTIGLKKAMIEIAAKLENCDINYPIIPSYTYKTDNLDELLSRTDEKYHKAMIEKDNLDPAIAAHWGPNACGYIYVEKE